MMSFLQILVQFQSSCYSSPLPYSTIHYYVKISTIMLVRKKKFIINPEQAAGIPAFHKNRTRQDRK